jgi:hypothetical protein
MAGVCPDLPDIKGDPIMNTDFIITAAAVVAVIFLAVWRFSSGNYGRILPNNEITAAYNAHHSDPQCSYFISGPDDFPNAIMGLNKAFTLDNDLWKGIDPTQEKIKNLVDNMTHRAAERNEFLQGYAVLDEKGHTIGNWFSLPGLDIAIKRSGERNFMITTPSIEPRIQR